MKRFLIASLVALSVTAPAAAKILTLTFAGTLTSGDDNTGVFGSSTVLDGEAASVRFTIDTSLGTRTEADSKLDYIGGYFYPAGTPVTSGAITVNGVTHIVGFPIFGELLESVPPGAFGDYIQASVGQLSENQSGPVLHFDDISAFSGSASNGQLTPSGFDKPFSYTTSAGDLGTVTFTVFARNIETDAIIEDAQGTFSPDQVTLTVAGVPEPATWSLLVVGFGLTGVTVRRRQVRQAAI